MDTEAIKAIRPTDVTPLSFDRTIDRKLVHRAAVSEVFLTDIRKVDETTVLIGAQLPRCHGYFGDHSKWQAHIDPLLLLEVARQATLGSAHALNVPKDTILISSESELKIYDIDVFRDQGYPTPVQIENIFDWTAMRDGVARAGLCKQIMSVNGVTGATHWSSGRLMSYGQLEILRTEQRGEAPPWTAQMMNRSAGIALPPEKVGRYNPVNVVLARLEVQGDMLEATIAPPWQNRALFDHSYDHLTMQILTEAARQLAMIALSRGADTADCHWSMTTIRGNFDNFAEIDLPAIIKTRMPEQKSGEVALTIAVFQAGRQIASIELVLVPEQIGGEGGVL
jgi:2-oxo-3-(phosphooxy)propyl 3-oxoalkanoate synthase